MSEFKSVSENYGIKYPEGMDIKSIKSKFNNQLLSIKKQPINDITYAISINDKCLYGYDNDIELKNCANTNNYIHPQYFEARKINNISQEKKYMNGQHTTARQPESYTAFIHKSTQQCLTVDNEGAYMAPCNADNIYQRWKISPDENICLE
jgi:hypothetical protein